GPDAEHGANIDEPQSAHFHEMLHQVGARSHQQIFFLPGDDDHVIRHEAMAALDQIQSYLAFPDTRFPYEQEADSVDIHQGPVNGLLQRELVAEEIPQDGHEVGRGQGRPIDRDSVLCSRIYEALADDIALRQHDAWNRERDERLEGL